MKITDALKGEHGVLYAQFDALEAMVASGTLSEIQAQAALLTAGLVPHAQIEDEMLFSLLEAQTGTDAPTAAFRSEHGEVEATLARLPATRRLDEAGELIREVLDAVRGHFAREESMLFPMAEQLLSVSQLEELGELWAERRSVMLE